MSRCEKNYSVYPAIPLTPPALLEPKGPGQKGKKMGAKKSSVFILLPPSFCLLFSFDEVSALKSLSQLKTFLSHTLPGAFYKCPGNVSRAILRHRINLGLG